MKRGNSVEVDPEPDPKKLKPSSHSSSPPITSSRPQFQFSGGNVSFDIPPLQNSVLVLGKENNAFAEVFSQLSDDICVHARVSDFQSCVCLSQVRGSSCVYHRHVGKIVPLGESHQIFPGDLLFLTPYGTSTGATFLILEKTVEETKRAPFEDLRAYVRTFISEMETTPDPPLFSASRLDEETSSDDDNFLLSTPTIACNNKLVFGDSEVSVCITFHDYSSFSVHCSSCKPSTQDEVHLFHCTHALQGLGCILMDTESITTLGKEELAVLELVVSNNAANTFDLSFLRHKLEPYRVKNVFVFSKCIYVVFADEANSRIDFNAGVWTITCSCPIFAAKGYCTHTFATQRLYYSRCKKITEVGVFRDAFTKMDTTSIINFALNETFHLGLEITFAQEIVRAFPESNFASIMKLKLPEDLSGVLYFGSFDTIEVGGVAFMDSCIATCMDGLIVRIVLDNTRSKVIEACCSCGWKGIMWCQHVASVLTELIFTPYVVDYSKIKNALVALPHSTVAAVLVLLLADSEAYTEMLNGTFIPVTTEEIVPAWFKLAESLVPFPYLSELAEALQQKNSKFLTEIMFKLVTKQKVLRQMEQLDAIGEKKNSLVLLHAATCAWKLDRDVKEAGELLTERWTRVIDRGTFSPEELLGWVHKLQALCDYYSDYLYSTVYVCMSRYVGMLSKVNRIFSVTKILQSADIYVTPALWGLAQQLLHYGHVIPSFVVCYCILSRGLVRDISFRGSDHLLKIRSNVFEHLGKMIRSFKTLSPETHRIIPLFKLCATSISCNILNSSIEEMLDFLLPLEPHFAECFVVTILVEARHTIISAEDNFVPVVEAMKSTKQVYSAVYLSCTGLRNKAFDSLSILQAVLDTNNSQCKNYFISCLEKSYLTSLFAIATSLYQAREYWLAFRVLIRASKVICEIQPKVFEIFVDTIAAAAVQNVDKVLIELDSLFMSTEVPTPLLEKMKIKFTILNQRKIAILVAAEIATRKQNYVYSDTVKEIIGECSAFKGSLFAHGVMKKLIMNANFPFYLCALAKHFQRQAYHLYAWEAVVRYKVLVDNSIDKPGPESHYELALLATNIYFSISSDDPRFDAENLVNLLDGLTLRTVEYLQQEIGLTHPRVFFKLYIALFNSTTQAIAADRLRMCPGLCKCYGDVRCITKIANHIEILHIVGFIIGNTDETVAAILQLQLQTGTKLTTFKDPENTYLSTRNWFEREGLSHIVAADQILNPVPPPPRVEVASALRAHLNNRSKNGPKLRNIVQVRATVFDDRELFIDPSDHINNIRFNIYDQPNPNLNE